MFLGLFGVPYETVSYLFTGKVQPIRDTATELYRGVGVSRASPTSFRSPHETTNEGKVVKVTYPALSLDLS